MSTSILLAGPTGLIGSTTLLQALNDDRVGSVIALSRRPLPVQHAKLRCWVHEDLVQALRPEPVDAVLCCLGTTIGKEGGDQGRFIHVDRDLVVAIGRWAREQRVPVFAVVSAVGADARSRVFYNRVKGEMEQGLLELAFPTLHVFQPSILTGPRQESRVGERIGIVLARLLKPLLPSRYRPMPHDVLAGALLHAAGDRRPGVHVHQGTGIHRMAQGA